MTSLRAQKKKILIIKNNEDGQTLEHSRGSKDRQPLSIDIVISTHHNHNLSPNDKPRLITASFKVYMNVHKAS